MIRRARLPPATLALASTCATDEVDELRAPLEADDDAAAGPAGADDLTQGVMPAVPGFDVDISVVGDDVTFDWTASSSFNSLCGGPGVPAFEIIPKNGLSTAVDEGAVSQSSATPTYSYRVVRIFESLGGGRMQRRGRGAVDDAGQGNHRDVRSMCRQRSASTARCASRYLAVPFRFTYRNLFPPRPRRPFTGIRLARDS